MSVEKEKLQELLESKGRYYVKRSVPVLAVRLEEEVIIATLEGELRARPGDYVVQGVRGELYPVAREIFEETYVEAPDRECEDVQLDRWMELLLPFYQEAPASTGYHSAQSDGLLVHTRNVLKVVEQFYRPGIKSFTLCEALLAAWLHDIGKIGRLEVRDGRLVVAEPYYTWNEQDQRYRRNPNVPDHVELGQWNLMQVLKLYPDLPLPWDVWLAVTYHNGAYHANLKWPIRGNETPLMVFIHFCDMVASRFMEEREQREVKPEV